MNNGLCYFLTPFESKSTLVFHLIGFSLRIVGFFQAFYNARIKSKVVVSTEFHLIARRTELFWCSVSIATILRDI